MSNFLYKMDSMFLRNPLFGALEPLNDLTACNTVVKMRSDLDVQTFPPLLPQAFLVAGPNLGQILQSFLQTNLFIR